MPSRQPRPSRPLTKAAVFWVLTGFAAAMLLIPGVLSLVLHDAALARSWGSTCAENFKLVLAVIIGRLTVR